MRQTGQGGIGPAGQRRCKGPMLLVEKWPGESFFDRHGQRARAMALRAEALVFAKRRRRVSISFCESSANMSPIQSPFSRAMARKNRRAFGGRRTIGARRPAGE